MRIPLSVLLYQLSADSIYETHNIELTFSCSGIRLFEADTLPANEADESFLYLVTESTVRERLIPAMTDTAPRSAAFLCVCGKDGTMPGNLPDALSIIFLYTENTFSSVFNRLTGILQTFMNWEKDFHLALLQKQSLQQLLDLSRNYLVHPMVVLDRNFTLLGSIQVPGSTDPIMEDILEAGYVTPETMNRLRKDGLVSPAENTTNPMINWYCITTKDCYYSMMYRYQANHHTVGYALVFRCSVHPKTNYLDIMNLVSENIQLYFRQDRYSSRSTSEIYEPVFTQILEHPDTPRRQYEDQISYVPDLDMEGYFILSHISYAGQMELPLSFVCWSIRNSLPKLKPFTYQNSLYALKVNDRDHYNVFLDDPEKKLLEGIFGAHSFSCAISNAFFSLEDIPIAADQCAEAMQLCPLLKGESAPFFRFSDVEIFCMLRELKKTEPMKLCYSPCYSLLKRYDEEHKSDLCEVFMNYLENGRSINQTASAIYLHRNTILNKVKKAISVMQSDCTDYQTQIAFVLSYLDDHVNY